MHPLARLAFATVLLGFWAPVANASVGVGIQANPVRLSGSAHPGGSYRLPPLYVVNTGSQAESLTVQVERLRKPAKGTSAVPRSWIQSSWTPDSPIPAGQSANIPLRLVAPADAKPGSYSSDIVVTGAPLAADGDVRFGAAAATSLDFKITATPPGGLPAWKLWTIVALIVIGVAILAYRRLGLRVRIERQGGRFGT